jgi:putative DNA primase/helicase
LISGKRLGLKTMANNIIEFAELGENKVAFFNKMKRSPNNVPKFVKQYSINSSINVPKRERDKKGKIIYEPRTEALIFKAGLHLIFYGEQVLLYSDGWYQVFNERFFLKLIGMQIHKPFSWRRSQTKEIFELLKDILHDEELKTNTEHNLINIKNGLFNINTFNLEPHTPNKLFTYQINAKYDQDAKCERFETFLKEVLVTEDKKKPDDELIRLVQQFVGYCMYIKIPYHQCLILYGKGRNGKSVLVFVIMWLFKRLTSQVQFEEIGEDKFATADLVSKLVNVSSEFSVNAKLSDGRIKGIIAGDEQRAQRKHQAAFDFRPIAKHIITTNNLPRSRDNSYGFFSRFMIIPFHKTFIKKSGISKINDKSLRKDCSESDPYLEERLRMEVDGILLWALKGLSDLLENKGFCHSTQVEKYKKIFKIRCTSVESFMNEKVDVSDSTQKTTLQDLFNAYLTYCKGFHIPPETKRAFTESIKNLGYVVDRRGGNISYVLSVRLIV